MRKIVMRHLSRDKKNEKDPQTPTLMGFIETFVMGLILATKYSVKMFTRIVSSPQARGMRTAWILQVATSLFARRGDSVGQLLPIETAEGLNDFSSDPRFGALKKAFKVIKGRGAALESEQALFMAEPDSELEALRLTKLEEAVAVIDETEGEGDILIGGIHGATIDGIFHHYWSQFIKSGTPDGTEVPAGMSAFGRMMDKCEGFILSYDADGELVSIEKIVRPAWLNALSALVK